MTTTVLNQPRMPMATPVAAPLLKRIWTGLMTAGARRAAAELRRQAAMRLAASPEVAAQMRRAAATIEAGL